jgi:preprotein translocase subunit SecD
MYRTFIWIAGIAFILFGGVLQAQAQLTMNAAANEPVAGWQKMEIEGRSVWVNPTPALTSADIQGAEPASNRDYGNFVAIVFTDAGSKKMQELSTAQMNKLIAIMLDGKVISAPRVRSVISNNGVITGKAPDGLTLDEVRRILTSVNQRKR